MCAITQQRPDEERVRSLVGLRGAQAQIARKTHDFKMATFVRGVLWAVERSTKMKGRIVDEIYVDVGRLVIIAGLMNLHHQITAYMRRRGISSAPAISLFILRSRASEDMTDGTLR
jgi:hypothetical protein